MGMKVLYGNNLSVSVTGGLNTKLAILKRVTINAAAKYDDPKSVEQIPAFVKYHNINLDESVVPEGGYGNFNEFFYRRLKEGSRPVDSPDDDAVAVLPADARCMVFPTVSEATRIWIKGRNFSPLSLVINPALAELIGNGGTVVLTRLAPQDYHRYHHAVTGTVVSVTPVDGQFYTVNPIAVRSQLDVLNGNKRVIVEVASEEFGTVVYVVIGATMVGSIRVESKVGDKVIKGGDFGYFAFGGSTVVTLFEPGCITLCEDLLLSSQPAAGDEDKVIETLVRVGQPIGSATGLANAAHMEGLPDGATAAEIEEALGIPGSVLKIDQNVVYLRQRKHLDSAIAMNPIHIQGQSIMVTAERAHRNFKHSTSVHSIDNTVSMESP